MNRRWWFVWNSIREFLIWELNWHISSTLFLNSFYLIELSVLCNFFCFGNFKFSSLFVHLFKIFIWSLFSRWLMDFPRSCNWIIKPMPAPSASWSHYFPYEKLFGKSYVVGLDLPTLSFTNRTFFWLTFIVKYNLTIKFLFTINLIIIINLFIYLITMNNTLA